tara:strand:- start:18859 stop:20652 length:1794 start_codon:yes stop_codon:yes gene_type:complete
MPAVSKAQQRFFGMVRAAQKGEMDSPSPQIQRAAASIKKKDAKDFASTKHKGLPEKKMKSFSEMQHLPEEEYDHYRDRQLERGTWRSSSSNRPSTGGTQSKAKGKTPMQKADDKKYGAGTSAIDRVKADIIAKYGKGAIMKTKKEAVEYTGPNKDERKQIKKLDNPTYAKKLAEYEKNMDPKKRQALRDKATKGMKFTHEGKDHKDVKGIAKELDKAVEMHKSQAKRLRKANVSEEKKGLYANIHAKRKRGEAPAKPGDEDYPAKDAFKKAAKTAKEEVDVYEASRPSMAQIWADRRNKAHREAGYAKDQIKWEKRKDKKEVKKEEALDEVIKMSRAEYKKIHKDFKSDDPKKPRTTKYEPGKGTVSHAVEFTDDYQPEGQSLEEKRKGLWANIHAKRKRGERPAKPGEKDYPKTLNVEAKVDEKLPDYKRATARDKRYGNPHGSHELGGGIRKDRRADHEIRRGKKTRVKLKEDMWDQVDIFAEMNDWEISLLSDELIEDIITDVFIEELQEGRDIDSITNMLCESVDYSLNLLTEVSDSYYDSAVEASKKASRTPAVKAANRRAKLEKVKGAAKRVGSALKSGLKTGAKLHAKAL